MHQHKLPQHSATRMSISGTTRPHRGIAAFGSRHRLSRATPKHQASQGTNLSTLDEQSPYDQRRYISRQANMSRGSHRGGEELLASSSTTDGVSDREFPLRANSLDLGEMMTPRAPRPGRPRSERVMLRLATSIEIDLRDRLDAYAAAHRMSIVDIIDEAIRARLSRDSPS